MFLATFDQVVGSDVSSHSVLVCRKFTTTVGMLMPGVIHCHEFAHVLLHWFTMLRKDRHVQHVWITNPPKTQQRSGTRSSVAARESMLWCYSIWIGAGVRLRLVHIHNGLGQCRVCMVGIYMHDCHHSQPSPFMLETVLTCAELICFNPPVSREVFLLFMSLCAVLPRMRECPQQVTSRCTWHSSDTQYAPIPPAVIQ